MSRFVRFLLLAAPLALLRLYSAESPIDLGSRLELFVDRHLIDHLSGVQLRLSEPHFAGVVFRFEKPWEGPCTGFFTVIRDGDLYRMYYVGCPLTDTDDDLDSYPCYAESRDGIHWTKPDLELCEFGGSKKNNILILPNVREPYATNFAPFLDTRPEVPPNERFKAVGGGQPNRPKGTCPGLWALASGDGIHWRKWRNDPILLPQAILGNDGHDDFDMQNCAFWSESENCYVLYYRIATEVPAGTPDAGAGGCRNIARTTSPDFIHWSRPERIGYGDTPLEQLYTITAFPYFRAPQITLSFPMRFVDGRRFLTDRQWEELKVVPLYYKNTIGILTRTPSEVSDSVFMTSRGGNRFDRTFLEAFIRPGPDIGNWVARDGMSARGLAATGATEISLYHQSHYAQPTAYLGRYTLRTDGFISVNAPHPGGEMTTKPLIVSGPDLALNAATSAVGSLRLEVQDPSGNPIPGFSLLECREIVGDGIALPVRWGRGYDLRQLVGRAVRLRFQIRDADLYAMQFH